MSDGFDPTYPVEKIIEEPGHVWRDAEGVIHFQHFAFDLANAPDYEPAEWGWEVVDYDRETGEEICLPVLIKPAKDPRGLECVFKGHFDPDDVPTLKHQLRFWQGVAVRMSQSLECKKMELAALLPKEGDRG